MHTDIRQTATARESWDHHTHAIQLAGYTLLILTFTRSEKQRHTLSVLFMTLTTMVATVSDRSLILLVTDIVSTARTRLHAY